MTTSSESSIEDVYTSMYREVKAYNFHLHVSHVLLSSDETEVESATRSQ
jgi:hypothetical protein